MNFEFSNVVSEMPLGRKIVSNNEVKKYGETWTAELKVDCEFDHGEQHSFVYLKMQIKETKCVSWFAKVAFTVFNQSGYSFYNTPKKSFLHDITGKCFPQSLYRLSPRKFSQKMTKSIRGGNLLVKVELRHPFGCELTREVLMSDFVIQVEGVSFPVHKWVLSTHSPVFEAMFESKMAECTTNTLNITDYSSEVVGVMLTRMYKPSSSSVLDKYLPVLAVPLLAITHQYGLEQLFTRCACYLLRNVTFENVLHMLQLADLYDIASLKHEAFNIMIEEAGQVDSTQRILDSLVGSGGNMLLKEFVNYMALKITGQDEDC